MASKQEIIGQFEELRHEVLNFTSLVKGLTNQLLHRCEKMEEAIRLLGSNVRINNDK